MALDKEYLKSKVIQGIKLMPYKVTVLREKLNEFNEVCGLEKVCDLVGVLYNSTNTKIYKLSVSDVGVGVDNEEKTFLVDYNNLSTKVLKGDYICYKDKYFKVTALGENLEILFQFNLSEVNYIKGVEIL